MIINVNTSKAYEIEIKKHLWMKPAQEFPAFSDLQNVAL